MQDYLLDVSSPFFWAAAVVVAALLMRRFEHASLFKPTRNVIMDPSAAGLEFQEIEFVAEDDVPLTGWWLPHENARGTILYCHGNAYNIGDRIPLLETLHRLECSVFIFDYRGYGKSGGHPTEKGLYRDARAAYEVVRAKYADTDEPPVVIFGCSLGGAVAVQLAMEKPAKGLIIEGTFSSVRAMAEYQYPMLPLKWFIRSKFKTAEKISHITIPKLIAHSRADEVIPYSMGQEIYQAAADPKQFHEIQGLHSENAWETTPGYLEELKRFIYKVL